MNISSLITPSLIDSAKTQLINQVKDKVIQTINDTQNKIKTLQNRIITTNTEYDGLIKKTQEDPSLTQEQKDQKINELQQQRQKELETIQNDISNLTKSLTTIKTDPLKQAKEEKIKINKKINDSIVKSKKDQKRANINRIRQVSKTLPTIMLSQLTNILISITTQNGKLQILVNKTNEVIDSADTPEKIEQAKILRNTALNILNNQEQKILRIRNILDRIRNVIQIITTIISIINNILSLPSPIPIPTGLKVSLQPILQKILKILEALNIVLNIAVPILDSIILTIEDLKSQLRNINDILDGKAANNIPNLNSDITFGTDLGSYKGFKFALKEDTNPKTIVRGNKRHYAVAIDTNNVEVLKSEYSYTLDPNDLIEQLKLIIDQQNLIA